MREQGGGGKSQVLKIDVSGFVLQKVLQMNLSKTRAQEQLVSVIRAGRDVCRAVIASKVAESPLANCCGPVILVSKSATIFRRVAAEN